MRNVFPLTLILIATLFPFVAFSQSASAYNYQAVFNFLEDDMPDAFDVGQSVLFHFEVDFSAEGQLDGEIFTYRDAISEFRMNAPEAGFSAALPLGDLFLDKATNEVSMSLFGGGESFQDQELISLELVLFRVGGGIPFDGLSNSDNFFDEAAVSRWSVSFANATGTSATNGSVSFIDYWWVGITNGSELNVVPEPSAYSLFIGLVIVAFVATARRKV